MSPADELDQLILTHFPYPLAVNYKRLLGEPDLERKTRTALQVFEFGLRAVALQVISQYMQNDIKEIPDPTVNQLLSRKIDKATLGVWRELLFTTLDAYAGYRDRLACPELADLRWEPGTDRERKGIQGHFVRLIEIRNRLAHRLPPQTEEAWRDLYQKVAVDLRAVLELFSFLQNYDLMLCRQGEGGRECVFFTGLEPQIVRGDLPAEMPSADHEFYLRRKDGQRLVPLHPLIIHWQKAASDAHAIASSLSLSDAALYDSFTSSVIHYLATVVWENVEIGGQAETFQEFFTRIGTVLDQIGKVRRREPRLTWKVLEDVAGFVVEDRLGTAEDRYDPALYLPREAVHRAFKEFLSSDKPAFVLLGSSGVGKSCFVLSLVEEYRDVDECCILMYDSAHFDVSVPIRQILSQHFSDYLEISTAEGVRRIDDILTEINQIDGIAHRRVVLIFDAINEHEAPDKLLRQICALVQGPPFTWLKVVLTCRPEAWRRLRARKDLILTPSKYYRISDAAQCGIQFAGSGQQPPRGEDWIQLRPFSLEELPAVYARYQGVFQLQDGYGDLPVNVREIIRDPLALKLVAETWAGKSIPGQLRAAELRRLYIKHLLDTKRLDPMDLDLLVTDLVPLMISPGNYTNQITADQIRKEQLNGVRLLEVVYSQELLGGEPINQRFMDLVNADILTLRGSDPDREIGFEYERFYEYFAGQRLYDLVNTPATRPVTDKVAAYADLGVQAQEKSFLWGALKDALFVELEKRAADQGWELFLALAGQQTSSLRSALQAALVEFAQAAPGPVQDLVSDILTQAGQKQGEVDPQTRGSGTLAVELAARLGSWEALEKAALMPSEVMRSLGVTYLYYLWPTDPRRGEQAMQAIADRVTAPRLGFDRDALEAFIGYSLPVLFAHRTEPDTVKAVQRVWQGVLAQFPFSLLLRGGGVLGGISRAVMPGVIFVVTRIAGILRAVAPEGESVNALAEMDAFFHKNDHTRRQIERLIPYIDPARGDITAEEETILELAAGRDGIAQLLTWAILLSHGVRQPEQMLPLLQKAFHAAVGQSPPTPYTHSLIAIVQNILYEQDPVGSEWLALAERWMRRVMEKSRFKMQTKTGAFRKSYLDWYLHNYYRLYHHTNSELARDYMRGYKDGSDPKVMEDFVACMGTLGMELRNPPAVTDAIETFCDLHNADVRKQLLPLLATLRFHDLETVEQFLERSDAPSSFKDQVRCYPPKETVGLLLVRLGAWTIRDTILIRPNPWLMRHFQAMLFGIVRSSNTNQALRTALATLTSIVYGEDPPPLH
ncbi:MAG: hypothetical protein JXM73_16460 [Anaerolineae bacterium]|nr:hypothetical protein [Anaerolineae bacterium]